MSRSVHTKSARQSRRLRPAGVAAGLIAFSLFPATGQAAWTGVGAGGAGTDFNNTGNWAGGTIDGSFVNNTTTPGSPITLSAASTALTGLNFTWTTSAIDLNINGDGAGGNEVIALTGDILLSRAGASSANVSTVTIGSDVTLDYGASFTATRNIKYGAAGSGLSKLVIDGLVTGTAGVGGKIDLPFFSTNPNAFFNNTNNSFNAPISNAGGNLLYTSIGNVGGGNSALGAPTTPANGTISFGGTVVYKGSANTTSDRVLAIANGNVGLLNDSAGATTQTFTSNLTNGANNKTFTFSAANAGSVLDLPGTIPAGTNVNNVRINFNMGAPFTSTSWTGTVKFGGNNAYTGTTVVNNGKLLINGDQSAATGAVTVKSGATLGGSGKIGGAITVDNGGHLSPGNSVGTLTDTNTLVTLAGGAIYTYEIDGTTASPTNDLLDLTNAAGTVSFGGAWSLKVSNLGTVDPTGKTFVLIDYLGGNPANVGTPTVSFVGAGTSSWTGGSVSIDSANSRIILSGVTLVPEPASLGLLSLGGLMMLRRRHV